MAQETAGIRIGTKARNQPKTKDRNAEKVWSVLGEIKATCVTKARNRKWGKRKIAIHPQSQLSMTVNESQIQRYCDSFLYDLEEETLYYKSTELNENHRKCVTREELIELLEGEHERDHRHAETCYSSLREKYHPVVRETIIALYKQFVKCQACEKQVPLPKTSLVRRTTLARYPNSRWQMDLKKLPSCGGYEYGCNIVDCYSRFAMDSAIKSKTAKEVCRVILDCIYSYGPPHILQTDNGKEFNNSSLTAVMGEMKALKMNGRPYHPQSQGRVERLNQTLANFLRRDLQMHKDWTSRLSFFYYTYNTRVHRSLHG